MRNNLDETALKSRATSRPDDIRGAYFRDQTAIIHSLPFRRLKHKTQVFFDPGNDHVCTRIEHVLHVATVAATICKGLNQDDANLDEEMAFAIGLAHDLGHAPFGHAGESTINKLLGNGGRFIHEVNGLRVVDKLANDGKGLNLTFAVRDGIICHNGEKFEREIRPREDELDLASICSRAHRPATQEGCIVRLSDKIAYLGRDIEDALLANIISEEDVPSPIKDHVKGINAHLINELILDVVDSSRESGLVCLSAEKYELLLAMKNFNYSSIYGSRVLQDYKKYSAKILESLFEYLSELFARYGMDAERYRSRRIELDFQFGDYIGKMHDFYSSEQTSPNQIIADYISGMTDNYALDCMRQITIPKPISFRPKGFEGAL